MAGAGGEVGRQHSVAQGIRRDLVDGAVELDDGWDGEAADAVLDTVEREKSHVSTLADGLEDLADALRNSHAALGPAVQTVRDRIADAEAAGLQVGESSVRPLSGRDDIDQSTVDEHAEAISSAVDTVRSLDEHYGREIDQIAARLHAAIPLEVDRSPIPGPDDPWPGRGVDAITGAASGIGLECARTLLDAGAQVVLIDRAGDRLETLCAELGPRAHPLVVDLADRLSD